MSSLPLVQVQLEIGHFAIPKTEQDRDGMTHDWKVFVRGPTPDTRIDHFIERVVFYLHPSYRKSRRVIREPNENRTYEVKEPGYAGFELPIEIYFRTHKEPRKIDLYYDMYLRTDEPVTNTRREKLTFENPEPEFRKKLLKAGGELFQGIPPVPLAGGNVTSENPEPEVRKESPMANGSKPTERPIPLYLANSLGQLLKFDTDSDFDKKLEAAKLFKEDGFQLLARKLEDGYREGIKRHDEGDEEMAYALFCSYIKSSRALQDSEGFVLSLIDQELINRMNQLREDASRHKHTLYRSLVRRYGQRFTMAPKQLMKLIEDMIPCRETGDSQLNGKKVDLAVDARSRCHIRTLAGSKSSSNLVSEAAPVVNNSGAHASQSDEDYMLIVDCRHPIDFDESTICHPFGAQQLHIVNVPLHFSENVTSLSELKERASGKALEELNQCYLASKVVIMDWDSEEFVPYGSVAKLQEIFSGVMNRHGTDLPAYLLKGGFQAWFHTYKSWTTNQDVVCFKLRTTDSCSMGTECLFKHPERCTFCKGYCLDPLDQEGKDRHLLECAKKHLSQKRKANEDPECCICLNNPIDTAIFPCGHAIACRSCAQASRTEKNQCPKCRGPIAKLRRIFLN